MTMMTNCEVHGLPFVATASQVSILEMAPTREMLFDVVNWAKTLDPPLSWPLTVELVRRCAVAKLNPRVDEVSVYVAKGKLVFVPGLSVYRQRSSHSGQLAGVRKWTRIREGDRAVIACCEVTRKGGGTYSSEVHVAQWFAMQARGAPDSKSAWRTTPETMAMHGAYRDATRLAFGEELAGVEDGFEPDDAGVPPEQAAQEQTAANEAAAAARSGSVTASQAADVARSALRAARSNPTTSVPCAPAAQAAILAASPPVHPPSPPAPTYADESQVVPGHGHIYALGREQGYSDADVSDIASRLGGGSPLSELSDTVWGYVERGIRGGAATLAQRQECELLHDAYLAMPGHGIDGWDEMCVQAGLRSWVPKYLTQGPANALIELAEAAVRHGVDG